MESPGMVLGGVHPIIQLYSPDELEDPPSPAMMGEVWGTCLIIALGVLDTIT